MGQKALLWSMRYDPTQPPFKSKKIQQREFQPFFAKSKENFTLFDDDQGPFNEPFIFPKYDSWILNITEICAFLLNVYNVPY